MENKIDEELGEALLHLKPAKKKCCVGWRSFSLSVFKARCFSFVSRPLKSTFGYVAVGEAKKKTKKPLWQQERRPKLTAGDEVAEAAVKTKQPLRREPEQSSACILAQLRVDNNSGSSTASRYIFRSLFQWSVSVLMSCSCCMSRHLTSASHVDMDDKGTNLDHVTNDQLSVIWLNGGNRMDEYDDSIFGNQVGADSADFIATAVQRTDGNATLDVVESVASSAEYRVECGAAGEEIFTVNLGGSGEPTEALGGLSLTGYERIVFSVCPALLAVDGAEF